MSARIGVSRRELVGKELTAREYAVLVSAANGHSTSATGSRLFLATETVRKHRNTMMDKLGALNIAHAVHLAHERDLL